MKTKLAGKRVAILATDGFEQSELEVPRDELIKAGADVTIVGLEPGEITGTKGGAVEIQLLAHQADESHFAALVLPGGVANPDSLRMDADAVAFTAAFFEAGKPVAAICHGPWTLIEADVLHGRTVTSWPSLKTDLINAGATWVDQDVVQDGNLITSRKPEDLPAFCGALIEMLAAHDPTAQAHSPSRLEEMLARRDISHEVKQKILHEWERDARAVSRAENEGMRPGTEEARLDEIQHMKRRLEKSRRDPTKPH
jgi:protease I